MIMTTFLSYINFLDMSIISVGLDATFRAASSGGRLHGSFVAPYVSVRKSIDKLACSDKIEELQCERSGKSSRKSKVCRCDKSFRSDRKILSATDQVTAIISVIDVSQWSKIIRNS